MTRDQTEHVVDRRSLEAELGRILEAADGAGVTLRVLGSIGVAIHSAGAARLLPAFERTYADIDFAAYGRESREIGRVLGTLGYVDDRDVFIFSEGRRSIFLDASRQMHLDVFYDRLEFCHVIPIAGRLGVDRPTLPLAELLLSKLQIVRLNDKDAIDIVLLLLDHPLARGRDDEAIDLDRIAAICAEDWGWWRTLTMNLAKVEALTATYPQLDDPQRSRVLAACRELKTAIDAVPKPFAWRMRDRIGDRRQWWTDVDEVR